MLDSETETGSIDTAQTAQDARLTALETETGSIDTAQTAQDARLSALETETGSIDTAQTAQDARLTALETETGSIDTAQTAQDGRLDSIETFTASLDTTFEEIASGTHTLVSGSSQVTSGAASGEVLLKNASNATIDGSAIYSDGTDLISIGTATGNVGDLASGNQLSLYGSSISGLLSFDISGTAKSFDYVSSDYRYVDTNSGVGIVLKPDADATNHG
jgi:X-X-X-Leu-X-X-Gly heptad repeat protein